MPDSEKPLGATGAKSHYEKPGVAWEEMLEVRKTLAVACAKVAGRSATCNQFPSS